MVLALFLPWLTIDFTGKFNSSQAQYTLFGPTIGSTFVYDAIRPDDLARLPGELLGPVVVFLIVITLSIILINIVWPALWLRLLLLAISILGLLFVGFEYLVTNTLVLSINRNLVSPPKTQFEIPPSLHVGIGLPVWVVGVVIVFVSSVLIMVKSQPRRRINRVW